MNRELEGKVALVTGGGNGIGQAAALAFAREGARVVICDWDWHAGEETVARILRQGGDAQFISADVSKESDVAKLIAGVLRRYDRLDIAFNNAGISGSQGPVAALSEADWSHVLAVNLTGVFLCMKHELSQMEKQGSGSIINNASILGTVGFAGAAAYTATKHGVLGLTKVAAIEYATKGIRVNAVCPGFIETPMLERAGLLSDAKIRKSIEDLHAVKRLGTSTEVAEAVVFLASPRSSFITGHPLLVDGGFVSM
ncbi:MAG TPA: SDR family oxidoreductase [Polyangiaceae bacterium]|nr:SDR family oxidoreductase [Polyangiaceae bacterium]